MTRGEIIARAAQLLDFKSPGEMEQFLAYPEQEQQQILADKLGENWSPPGPGAVAELLPLLGTLSTIAADLTGVGVLVNFLRAL